LKRLGLLKETREEKNETKIQSLEEAFSGYPEKEQNQARSIARQLLGFPIIDLEFGPDPNGKPTILLFGVE